MNAYGKAAIVAVQHCRSGNSSDPAAAWNVAVSEVFPRSMSQQKKGCPRGAFLGLCEKGYVAEIPSRNYTRSKLNKLYAVKAVKLLRLDPQLAADTGKLWNRVLGGKQMRANGQMDVVVALWGSGYIS